MSKPAVVRRKKKYKSPNPLFEQWLKEWKDAAAEKGLKTHFNFAKALSSLKKYPLPLSSGKEAKILENFGDKICSMLDERLKQHNAGLSQNDSLADKVVEKRVAAATTKKGEVQSTSGGSLACDKVRKNPEVCSVVLPPVYVPQVLPEDPEELVDPFTLQPGMFDVYLCIDSIETSSAHSKNKKQFICELQKCGVPYEIRKLNVADFIWIAKERASSSKSRELVMDFVVERKRLDDLAHSIKDGRFREQKFRLRNCGARKPIYLVEYHSSHQFVGIPESTLEQAIVNTQVIDGFIIKRTRDMKESIAYLSSVTKHLQSTLQMHALTSGSWRTVQNNNSSSKIFLTFEEFNCGSVKNKCLNVREMFAKHLLQFHGLSVDRAAALVEKFETPSKLFMALQSCSTEVERTKMLSEVKYGKFQKNIGQALGKVVQHFYSASGPLQ